MTFDRSPSIFDVRQVFRNHVIVFIFFKRNCKIFVSVQHALVNEMKSSSKYWEQICLHCESHKKPKMTTLLGLAFILHYMKLSDGNGFWRLLPLLYCKIRRSRFWNMNILLVYYGSIAIVYQ